MVTLKPNSQNPKNTKQSLKSLHVMRLCSKQPHRETLLWWIFPQCKIQSVALHPQQPDLSAKPEEMHMPEAGLELKEHKTLKTAVKIQIC